MASFTKMAIMKVFGDLASSKPVDKITVKDITDRCGISRNTFYYHYQDIYQVLRAYVEYSVQRVVEIMTVNQNETDPQKACMRGAEYLEEHRGLFCNLFRSAVNEEVRDCLKSAGEVIFDCMVDRIAEGTDICGKDKQMISSMCQYTARGLLISWMESDGTINGERSDIKVAKVNVDEQPELAGQFGVMSIPTLVVVKEGRIVQQAMGARPKAQILSML